MNDKLLFKRMYENYSLILRKMTVEEQFWAEDFERLEYAIERGHTVPAVRLARSLYNRVSQETIRKIYNDIEAKDRCNPVRAERVKRKHDKNRKTDRKSPDTMYDASDWVKQKFGYDPQTGEEYELVTSTNPEDALIQALDAANAHGVSLDEFINNPKYHTAERKAGRPKKVQEYEK